MTRKNIDLSGFPCRWVTIDDIRQWAKDYYTPLGLDPDEFDEDDLVRAYAVHFT